MKLWWEDPDERAWRMLAWLIPLWVLAVTLIKVWKLDVR